MPKQELSVYDVIEKHLFKSRGESSGVLSEKQLEVKERLMLCVSKKLENPMTTDAEIVRFLMGGCGGTCVSVSQSQAYRDVAALNKIVGNIQLSSKSWYRYMIVEAAKKGYEIAKDAKDAKGMAANIDKIGKYTRADREDDDFNWEEMIPPSWEPTDDITVLEGMEPIENLEEHRLALRRLWKKELSKTAEDTNYEECHQKNK